MKTKYLSYLSAGFFILAIVASTLIGNIGSLSRQLPWNIIIIIPLLFLSAVASVLMLWKHKVNAQKYTIENITLYILIIPGLLVAVVPVFILIFYFFDM
jgi:glycerol-3-phosphate acyltransferase PlsY